MNDLSFYAHHLSPHIFLFGAPLAKLLGFTGFEIFAYHQGLFFGLFFLSFCLIVARSDMRRRDWMFATASALVLGGLSNALFQAASYPHYEIAMIAIASLAIAAWLAHYRLLFVLCLAWLPLVREDGGFYAAIVCIACIALPKVEEDERATRLLTVLALAGLAASASSFLVKAWLFPGFSAFANNFSGDGWNHVRAAFVADRVQAMLRNLNILPVLLGSAVLAAFDIRYLTGLVLLSPILLLHLLAVRPEHGYFTLVFRVALAAAMCGLARGVRQALHDVTRDSRRGRGHPGCGAGTLRAGPVRCGRTRIVLVRRQLGVSTAGGGHSEHAELRAVGAKEHGRHCERPFARRAQGLRVLRHLGTHP